MEYTSECIVCLTEVHVDEFETLSNIICDICLTNLYETDFVESEEDNALGPDEDEDAVDLELLEEEWYREYMRQFDDDFDIYDHFGIPSDIDEDQQDAMLEAARDSY